MFNYMKHLPIQSLPLQRDIDCKPRGPGLPGKQNLRTLIAGSVLRLKAPRHSPLYRESEQMRLLPGEDLLEHHSLGPCGSNGVMVNEHWGAVLGLVRRWAFWGPWLSGCKGELHLSISVIGRQPGREFKGLSLFHPKVFEMVLIEFLNDSYGHMDRGLSAREPKTAYWHGPVDWQRHGHLPVFSASFNIYGRGTDHPGKTGDERLNIGGTPHHMFVFPITDQHFVEVFFEQHWYSTDQRQRPLFDTSPLQALQDAIFNSITLELSPEAQASYDKIKAEHGNMQLSKTFAPLQWPTHLYKGAEQESASDRLSRKLVSDG